MKLEKIIKGITVNEIIGDASQEISGINMDSRLIEPGHIFVAVKGTQTDGHTYIQKAIEKGARTVVCENLPETLIQSERYGRRCRETGNYVLRRPHLEIGTGRCYRHQRKNDYCHLII